MNKATEFIIRPARANDVTSIARVHIETWRTTYSDILPDEFLANLSIDQRICQWTRARQFPERNFLFVAEAGSDGVIGFVDAGPLQEGRQGYPGEIYAIYLLKKFQGQGIGRALFAEADAALKTHGYHAFMLWVLAANPACGFYEKMGGRAIDERGITIGGVSVRETAYGWDMLV